MNSDSCITAASDAKSIVCIGEALIDFVAMTPGTLGRVDIFKRAAGGAPANVAVGLSRLGVPSAYVGKLGRDPFGYYIFEVLRSEGVDVSHVVFSSTERTGLAFVSLTEAGERDFLFAIERSAETFLSVDDLDEKQLGSAAAVHVGTYPLKYEPARSAIFAAVTIASAAGAVVSFDPNLRPSMWPSSDILKVQALELWRMSNVVKVSEEELFFLANSTQREEAVKNLWHDQIRLLAVTLGSRGADVYTHTPENYSHVPGVAVKPVDTTGAGDGFVAGLWARLLSKIDRLSQSDAVDACQFANIVGGLTTTKRGAIDALPRLSEVECYTYQRR